MIPQLVGATDIECELFLPLELYSQHLYSFTHPMRHLSNQQSDFNQVPPLQPVKTLTNPVKPPPNLLVRLPKPPPNRLGAFSQPQRAAWANSAVCLVALFFCPRK